METVDQIKCRGWVKLECSEGIVTRYTFLMPGFAGQSLGLITVCSQLLLTEKSISIRWFWLTRSKYCFASEGPDTCLVFLVKERSGPWK